MELKPNSAKVVDIETVLEAVPVETGIGPILWATARIDYAMVGLSPHVDIRVPIPFEPGQSDTERGRQALRNARLLIDHACHSSGIPPEKATPQDFQDFVAEMLPASLQGVAQELGITEPTSQPGRSRRKAAAKS
jgi:hypothetical protein